MKYPMPGGQNKNIIVSYIDTHVRASWVQTGANIALPLSAIIRAAAEELRACGCTTRKAACRLYVKGTQARSPKTSMKPNPSWTMSMVVRTASCQGEVHFKCLREQNEPSIHRLCCRPPSPHSTAHRPRTAAGNSWPGSWPVMGNLGAPPPSSACPGLSPPESNNR